MKFILGALITLSLFAIDAEARNCKKGKPCGNSCIAMNRTCHIGSGTYSAPSRAATLPRATAPSTPVATGAAPRVERRPAQTHNFYAPSPVEGATMMPITEDGYVMERPTLNSRRIRRLSLTDIFTIYQTADDWVLVTHPHEPAGWVMLKHLAP